MIFHHLSWNQITHSKYKDDLPGKDYSYHFLNSNKFNWRKFLLELSSRAVDLIEPLTDARRINVFIVDDSLYECSRSKKTDMLSTIFDHVSHQYFNGFHLLTLGIPVDFPLAATVSHMINDTKSNIDKRSLSYRRRSKAKQKKTKTTVEMVKRTLNHGIHADYILMDTLFASPAMFLDMKNIGIDAICMLKKTTKHQYLYSGMACCLHG